MGYTVEVLDITTKGTVVYDTIGKAAISLGSSPNEIWYIKAKKLFKDRYLAVIKAK